MRPLVILAAAAAATVLSTACRQAPQAGTAPARISHHFTWRCDPRVGVIRGDLARARTAARTLLSDCMVEGAPASEASRVAEVGTIARSIADAADLRTAAAHTARLASACGNCHQSTSASLALTVVTIPDAGTGPMDAQMQRHYWASDRMWEGLIGPSERNWAAGTTALQEPSVYGRIAAQFSSTPTRVERIAAQMRELAARAATSPAVERPHVYGEFLAGCADCHTAVGNVSF